MVEGVSGRGREGDVQFLPALIVVSGPAGSGKTTLAHTIAQRLGVPAIIRDEIKQGMVLTAAQTLERDWDELNMPTLTAFFDVLAVLVRAGVTVVAEAAFQRRLWVPNLLPLVPVADIRIIHCTASTSAIQDRIIRRAEINPHRQAHNDRDLIAEITAGSHSVERFESVDLDVPTLTVDTTDGYCPDLEAIARFAKVPK
ncbi:AAA family ATPase [Nocardia sp. NPDC127606]|uniref:AAA family ATPase n=1 Tax=Nocardia sp. NPDC127606 TaxID=3345406 RepID=UPI003640C346